MPMMLRAKHEQAGRERALMSANCVALAADESGRDVSASPTGIDARGHIVDVKEPEGRGTDLGVKMRERRS